MEEELQEEALQQSIAQAVPEDDRIVLQITAKHFTFEELHSVLKRNGGKVVGLYNEVSVLYDLMDKHKSGKGDWKTFLSLYGAKNWR